MASDFRKALRSLWAILSLATAIVLVASFVLTPAQAARVTPQCVWRAKFHRDCACCGMTRAFLLISQGRFQEARAANRGSLPVYGGFLLNDFVFALVLWRRRRADHVCIGS